MTDHLQKKQRKIAISDDEKKILFNHLKTMTILSGSNNYFAAPSSVEKVDTNMD